MDPVCLEDNTYIRTGTAECKFQYKAPKVRQGSVKRICHTLCQEVSSTVVCKFLYRRCRTTTWMCQISRFAEDKNRRQQLSSSLPELWYIPLEFNSFFSIEIVSGSKRPRFVVAAFISCLSPEKPRDFVFNLKILTSVKRWRISWILCSNHRGTQRQFSEKYLFGRRFEI